ncbi:MAG: acetaldehyde dehydrogenase, partial [Anaerolineales bacterium]
MKQSDKDLLSIQEARQTVERAYEAQRIWGTATQQQVDRVCEAMAQAAFLGSERLGRLAAEETGFGVPEHK